MSSENILMLVSIVIYLGAVVLVGVWYSKKNKTTDDFYLGGRKLGPFVTAMSAEASDMSSWLLMGLPGVALLWGTAEAVWTAIGLAVGTYLNWLIVAKRIRRYSMKAGNATTIPDFFANRFRDKSGILMCASAIIIIIFFVPYTASGFKACGTLFNSLFGMNYHTAVIISAAVIALYTVIGGFLAASTTDFIQSIIMTVALIAVLGYGISFAGGLDAVFENAKSLSGYISLTSTHNIVTDAVGGYGFITIVSTLAWGLGYFGMPHILLRFMAIEDEKKLKLSRRIASVWVVISMAVAVLIGVIGYGMICADSSFNLFAGADASSASAVSETLIIQIAMLISKNGWLAALIAGLIMAGILAAIMSTSDSQMLAAASSVSENLIRKNMWKNMPEKIQMLIARATVAVITCIAVWLAWEPNSSVFKIVSFSWAGFGAAFGPLVLFALFWKRTNKWGAMAGVLSGAAMVFIWKFAARPLGGIWDIYELLPAFIVASIAIFAVSLLTPAPSKEITDEFEAVKNDI